MTTTGPTPNPAAAGRMTPDDFVVTTVASVFAGQSPADYYAYFAGFFAEAIRLIHAAHVAECIAGPNWYCDTCDAMVPLRSAFSPNSAPPGRR
jgi:hypothetical protein